MVGQLEEDGLLFCSNGPTREIKSEDNLTCGTLAFIAVRVINTFCSIQTWSTGTVININLANWPSETLKGQNDDTVNGLSYVCLSRVYLGYPMRRMPKKGWIKLPVGLNPTVQQT